MERGVVYSPHEDVSSDEIGVVMQAILTLRNVSYFAGALMAVAIIALSVSDWQNAHKPAQVETLLITKNEIAVLCSKADMARGHICPKGQTQELVTVNALSKLTEDPDAQYAVVQYVMPTFLRGAFTNTTPKDDETKLEDFVRPFLLPKSQAAKFFYDYYVKQNPSRLDDVQSTALSVAPIEKSKDGGITYYVSWTTTAYNTNGKASTDNTAEFTVEFNDQHTEKNIFGMYITGFNIVGKPTPVDGQPSTDGSP